MAKQTFTTGQVLTAAQMTSLQQTAMLGGAASAKTDSYVLTAADAGTAVSMNKATATTITVNTGLFAAGDIVTIINVGTGVCTITAGTATVSKAQNASLALIQNSGGVLYFTATGAATFLPFVTSIVPSQIAGKNKIINGDFTINQRAFTSTTANAAYMFDRWLLLNTDGTVTASAQTFTPGSAPVAGYEGINYLRIVTSGQTLTTASALVEQRIEDVSTLAGRTMTISFWAQAGSGTPKIALEIGQNFGAGGSPSAAVNTYAGQVTLSTSWERYSVTVAVPSISGKTIGTTANTSYNRINLWTSAGSSFDSRTGSLGIQSNTFNIWGVQVEEGSTATPFQTATGTIQGELAACQRYYWRTVADSAYSAFGNGIASSTTNVYSINPIPVTMRIAPSSLDYSNLAVYDGVTVTAVTSASLTYNNRGIGAVGFSVASGLTQYRPYLILSNNSTSAYLGFSAEL